ncbi:MAG: hypothetical protein JRH20_15750 [Deltaproteobacteria bacterium]|nr:hypothetical protein [Deltaproteobacteria bacterium]
MKTPLPWRLGAYGLISVLVYALVYRSACFVSLGPLRNLAATLLASMPLLFAAREAEAHHDPSRWHLLLLLVMTAAMRITIPFDLLVGTDDAYRYLWDGRVHAAGINPYLHAPLAPQLAPLRDALFFPRIFHPEMRTVYPPLAELWFLLAYALGGLSLVGLKLIYLAHDLASALLLWQLLHERKAPPWRALLLAWSPLCVVQSFAGAHLDVLLIPWLLLTLRWMGTRPFAAGCALGLSAMVRPLTALAGPTLALRRPFKETLWVTLGFFCAAAVLLLPYALGAGLKMTESLQVYGEHWEFNGSLYQCLRPLLHEWKPFRPALYGTIAVLSLLIGFLPGGRGGRLALSFAAYFAFAPTVYPWYLLGVLALIAPAGGALPVALPALITLSDLVFVRHALGGPWRVPVTTLMVEYAGLYGLVAWKVWQAWRGARKEESGH